jgi:serine protease Do
VIGDRVFTIRGVAGGQEVAEGTVVEQRALGSEFLLGISARVERGNSGGPLVDDRGQVVGVMTRRRSDPAGAAAKLSFAVKSSSARRAFEMLPAATAAAKRDRPAAIDLARRASCMIIVR